MYRTMLIAIIGPSGSGKSTIVNEMKNEFGVSDIIRYTTRNIRPGEKNHTDYHFITQDVFNLMEENGEFIETEKYSQARFYGTGTDGIIEALGDDKNFYCIAVTPGGFRAIKEIAGNNRNDLFSVYLDVPLGERVKRYIERCGIEKFNFDDMNEINARVNRDFGMFLGIEKEVDLIMTNYGISINEVTQMILDKFCERLNEQSMEDREI